MITHKETLLSLTYYFRYFFICFFSPRDNKLRFSIVFKMLLILLCCRGRGVGGGRRGRGARRGVGAARGPRAPAGRPCGTPAAAGHAVAAANSAAHRPPRLVHGVVMAPAAPAPPRAAPRHRHAERLRVQLPLRAPVRALVATLRPLNSFT